jgi:hypothetical protein
MTYAAREIRQQIAKGPYPGEDFFRLKLTGKGETRWVNVTPQQAERIAEALDDE